MWNPLASLIAARIQLLPAATFCWSTELKCGFPHGYCLSLITEVRSRAALKDVHGGASIAPIMRLRLLSASNLARTEGLHKSPCGP